MKERCGMNTWTWVVVGVVVVAFGALAVSNGPDLVRYMKIKKM
jgi:hypothetical protein